MMGGNSRCGTCIKRESCDIRNNLNVIINNAIKNAEAEVRKLSPAEIEYMLVTDIAVIPTSCRNYEGIEKNPEKNKAKVEDGLFF
ncbi:hypothetical protein N752_02775 [Desulforamulus aquiferis]|nr:hypothetical protein [Desulforamulus aquiferis]RYD06610.1 hypothetical protein N752_02775 [Desulforamulus aquiferis]